jgi:hypothetical protein
MATKCIDQMPTPSATAAIVTSRFRSELGLRMLPRVSESPVKLAMSETARAASTRVTLWDGKSTNPASAQERRKNYPTSAVLGNAASFSAGAVFGKLLALRQFLVRLSRKLICGRSPQMPGGSLVRRNSAVGIKT